MLRVVTMLEQEGNIRRIGEDRGMHTIVTRAWARFQQHCTPIRMHGVGRERAISADEEQFLLIQARRNLFVTDT